MKLTNAHTPRWMDASHTCIHLFAQFEHLGDTVIPFTATSYDVEPHGVDAFNRAVAGEFGLIEEFVPLDVAKIESLLILQQLKTKAMEQSSHWAMMDLPEMVTKWKAYYKDLHALATSTEWPLVACWPEEPDAYQP